MTRTAAAAPCSTDNTVRSGLDWASLTVRLTGDCRFRKQNVLFCRLPVPATADQDVPDSPDLQDIPEPPLLVQPATQVSHRTTWYQT